MRSELYRFRPRYLTNTQTHEYILSIGSILSKTNRTGLYTKTGNLIQSIQSWHIIQTYYSYTDILEWSYQFET